MILIMIQNKLKFIKYDNNFPHLAVIKLSNKNNRDSIRSFLKKRGIETLIHYPLPCHKQPFIKKNQLSISKVVASQAEDISSTIVSLPLSEVHTKEEIKYVGDTVNEFIKN